MSVDAPVADAPLADGYPRGGGPSDELVEAYLHADGEVFATCTYMLCNTGAIYVENVGPMGDERCTTSEQARATGIYWRYEEEFAGWICPSCDRAMLEDWPYVWRWRTMQDPNRPPGHRIRHPFAGRAGQRLRVIARGTMNSALIQFLDGEKSVVSRNAIKKARVSA